MAFCPQCRGKLDERAVKCPHCGFDFPAEPDPAPQFALGDMFLLMAGMALAYQAFVKWGLGGLGVVVMALGCWVQIGPLSGLAWRAMRFRQAVVGVLWCLGLGAAVHWYSAAGLTLGLLLLFVKLTLQKL